MLGSSHGCSRRLIRLQTMSHVHDSRCDLGLLGQRPSPQHTPQGPPTGRTPARCSAPSRPPTALLRPGARGAVGVTRQPSSAPVPGETGATAPGLARLPHDSAAAPGQDSPASRRSKQTRRHKPPSGRGRIERQGKAPAGCQRRSSPAPGACEPGQMRRGSSGPFPAQPFSPGGIANRRERRDVRPRQLQGQDRHGLLLPGRLRGRNVAIEHLLLHKSKVARWRIWARRTAMTGAVPISRSVGWPAGSGWMSAIPLPLLGSQPGALATIKMNVCPHRVAYYQWSQAAMQA